LAATVTVTVLEPVPLAGDTVAHVELLDAVQPHVVALAVTVTLAFPPAAVAVCVVEDSRYVQTGGTVAWNAKVFETSLRPVPVGPTAATRAW
jgi:hypothetical protein